MPAECLSPRPLGSSGIEVSALSLGSWRTFERIPAQTGIAVLGAARDQGINFFDDARYNDETGRAPIPTGYSEVLFGQLFRGAGVPRGEAVVSNKLWWEFWPEQGAAAELDASLGRMGFDYVDLIYANPPPPGLDVADLVAAVGELVASGKARAWGIVNWTADDTRRAVQAAAGLGIAPPCAAQLPYSLVHRSWVEDPAMTEALSAPGVGGIIASFSLAGGVLSGKYRSGKGAGRAAGTLAEPRYAAAAAAAADLDRLAGQLATTAAALALAFPLTNPAVTSVLFGATSPEQLRANCAAAALRDRLTPQDVADLRRIGQPAA
jgi:aryl-alcohol dehydrogenase-like predicted oxidoreductase